MKNRIRELRQATGISQIELAKALGVRNNAISRYENNLNEPNLEIWTQMAEYFGVSIDYLIGYSTHDTQKSCLKRMRQEKGKTLDEMAEETGINRASINNYENGKSWPKLETWQKLSRYFQTPINSLMDFTSEPRQGLSAHIIKLVMVGTGENCPYYEVGEDGVRSIDYEFYSNQLPPDFTNRVGESYFGVNFINGEKAMVPHAGFIAIWAPGSEVSNDKEN